MKTTKRYALLLIVALALGASPVSAEEGYREIVIPGVPVFNASPDDVPDDGVRVLLDDRNRWVLGYKAKSRDRSLVELVRKGQTIETALNVVRILEFPHRQGIDLESFYETYVEEMKEKSDFLFIHRMLAKSPFYIKFEITVIDGYDVVESILGKVASGRDGMWVLTYSTRDIPVKEELRKDMSDFINLSEVINFKALQDQLNS